MKSKKDVADQRYVRDQMDRILASKTFGKATQQRDLLRYLVREKLGGRGSQLSQSSIAKNVFGKSSDKDGSIVAVTAKRLKEKLQQYYRDEGTRDAVILSIPTGSYLPNVRLRDSYVSLISERNESVSIEEFRALVEDLTDLAGVEVTERDARTDRWIRSSTVFSTLLKDGSTFDGFITWLQEPSDPPRSLPFTEMISLAMSLGIHPVLMDPLLTYSTERYCVLLEFAATGSGDAVPMSPHAEANCKAGTFRRAGHFGQPSYGDKAQYYIPSHRLECDDLDFVQLDLQPGGYSDFHHHSGDELMIVMSSSVLTRFKDTGEEYVLGKGDYIHFYAEQTHSVRNISPDQEAQLFIVRFRQHRTKDRQREPYSRQEMRTHLHNFIDWRRAIESETDQEIVKRKEQHLTILEEEWLLEMAAGRSLQDFPRGVPDEIQNRMGLARFLMRHGKCAAADDWLEKFMLGKISVRESDFETVKRLFGVDFDPILHGFLYPSVPSRVILKRNAGSTDGDLDWVCTDKLFQRVIEANGVRYEIPKRSLAWSDIGIAWLTLEPGKVIPESAHPGSELLLSFEGEAKIQFVDDGSVHDVCSIRASEQVAHFWSSRKHRVGNFTDAVVKLLLVRFYGQERKGPAIKEVDN